MTGIWILDELSLKKNITKESWIYENKISSVI